MGLLFVHGRCRFNRVEGQDHLCCGSSPGAASEYGVLRLGDMDLLEFTQRRATEII